MAMEWAAAARLVRRTGFGADGDAVDAVVKEGAAAYVDRLLAADPGADPGAKRTPPPSFAGGSPAPAKNGDDSDEAKAARRKAMREQGTQLTQWWLRRMLAVEQPFGEKATFVWHSHFATSLKKVRSAALMLQHNERQRDLATGSFGTLAYAMLTDGAMQRWLDNVKNTVSGPNENLSREFMEIFTLGHGGGYAETDVREGARALTGYTVAPRTGAVTLRAARHDDKPKTIFGRTANYDAKSFCDAVLARPAGATYVVTRLWQRYAADTAPDAATLRRLLAAYGPKRDVAALLRTMLTDPSFTAAEGSFVTGPVEWLIGAMRALRVPATSERDLARLTGALDSLGQLPFYPPSVGGWPGGPVWLSTAAAQLRFRTAARFAQQADLDDVAGSTTSRLETLAHRLGVATWSPATLAVLRGSAADPRRLVTVAVNTPEYLVH